MGRTYEGLFKETVEVALKNKLDVAFDALVNLNFPASRYLRIVLSLTLSPDMMSSRRIIGSP